MIMHVGKGCNPEWNENFVYRVEPNFRLGDQAMDSDAGTADDFVGEATEVHIYSLLEVLQIQ
jgi:Ca2+-dependent lipid-binding protein